MTTSTMHNFSTDFCTDTLCAMLGRAKTVCARCVRANYKLNIRSLDHKLKNYGLAHFYRTGKRELTNFKR